MALAVLLRGVSRGRAGFGPGPGQAPAAALALALGRLSGGSIARPWSGATSAGAGPRLPFGAGAEPLRPYATTASPPSSSSSSSSSSSRRRAPARARAQVLRSQGKGGKTLGDDLVTAFRNIQSQFDSPGDLKFVVAVVNDERGEVTKAVIERAVRESGLRCPVAGAMAKAIRKSVRRGGIRSQPRVTCWSLALDGAPGLEAFAFLQKHASMMDLAAWSRTSLQDHVLDPRKQPFTFSFASQFFPVRELATRNKAVFDNALHCGASVKAVSFRSENYFVANAGKDGDRTLVSQSGVAGLGLVGLQRQKFDFIHFVRTVLSEHW